MKHIVYVLAILLGIAFGYLSFSTTDFFCPVFEEKRLWRHCALYRFRNKHVQLLSRLAAIATCCIFVVCSFVFPIDLYVHSYLMAIVWFGVSLLSTHFVLENNDIAERRELQEEWNACQQRTYSWSDMWRLILTRAAQATLGRMDEDGNDDDC